MAKSITDKEYLAVCARIRAMETQLLTKERMDRILEARTDEEAEKLIEECGYPDLNFSTPESMDASLLASRQQMLRDFEDILPDTDVLDLFRIKYDYHNVKAVLKARLAGIDADHLLMNLGRVDAAEVAQALERSHYDLLPPTLSDAAKEGKSILDTTRDTQLMDLALDRWYYREMSAVAEKTGSAFLQGYVRMQIDAVNLRALVRTIRMGKSTDFLRQVLITGGGIDMQDLIFLRESDGSGLAEFYASTPFAAAAESGAKILRGGAMTEFEKRCDDAVSEYLSSARLIPFGEQPVAAYLAARENEFTNLRILLLGRRMGLAGDVIRSRLRQSCI